MSRSVFILFAAMIGAMGCNRSDPSAATAPAAPQQKSPQPVAETTQSAATNFSATSALEKSPKGAPRSIRAVPPQPAKAESPDTNAAAAMTLYKVLAILPRVSPAGRVEQDRFGMQLPLYEALVVAKFPPGIKEVDRKAIRIDSIITDTGVELEEYGVTQGWPEEGAPAVVSKDGYLPLTIATRVEIPADAPGLWVTGALCPFDNGNEVTTTEKMELPLQLHAELKAGDVTLKIGEIWEFGPTTTQINFDSTGPVDKIAKIEFFDNKGVPIPARYDPPNPVQNTATRWRISLPRWSDPLFCQLTYAPNRHRIAIPFKIGLPSARVIWPDAVAGVPPLQVAGVSIVASTELLDKVFGESKVWRGGKPTPHVALLIDARFEKSNAIRIAPDGFKIDSWQEDDKPRPHPAAEAGRMIKQIRGYADLPISYPREEVCLDVAIGDLPAPGTKILALKGTAGVLLSGAKVKTMTSSTLDFTRPGTLKMDPVVQFTGLYVPGAGADGADSKTVVTFAFPDELAERIIGAQVTVDAKPVATQFIHPANTFDDNRAKSRDLKVIAEGKITAGQIKFFVSDTLEEKRLPFSMLIGVGARPN